MNITSTDPPCISDTHEPIALRVFSILVVFVAFVTSAWLCIKLKPSMAIFRNNRPFYFRFSAGICLAINNFIILFFLIFDHWSYLTLLDCEQTDVVTNVVWAVYNSSGLCGILFKYYLTYDRYKHWDIFVDKLSLIKKAFLKVEMLETVAPFFFKKKLTLNT